MSGWISVEDGLPEDYRRVLVTCKGYSWNCTEYSVVKIAYYDCKCWRESIFDDNTKNLDVIAWQPLPTPYESEE